MSGKLFIVATPIGNLDDITLRALATLKAVDGILAEDTRHAGILLRHFQIERPVQALHEHNERIAVDRIMAELLAGKNMALISDAGTPLISDPGFVLVRAAQAQGIAVVPIPGACAAIAALSVAGLPTDQFYFAGFLPAKHNARVQRLNEFKSLEMTIVCYESTHRIVEALADLAEQLPDRPSVLAKELTKSFETVKTGTAQELLTWIQVDPARQKGEFVLLIAGAAARSEDQPSAAVEKMLHLLAEHLPPKIAAGIAAEITGQKKNALYELLLSLKQR